MRLLDHTDKSKPILERAPKEIVPHVLHSRTTDLGQSVKCFKTQAEESWLPYVKSCWMLGDFSVFL